MGAGRKSEASTAASLFAHYQEIRQGQCDLFVVGNAGAPPRWKKQSGPLPTDGGPGSSPPVSEGTPQGGVEIREDQDVNRRILAMKRMLARVTYQDRDCSPSFLQRHPRRVSPFQALHQCQGAG